MADTTGDPRRRSGVLIFDPPDDAEPSPSPPCEDDAERRKEKERTTKPIRRSVSSDEFEKEEEETSEVGDEIKGKVDAGDMDETEGDVNHRTPRGRDRVDSGRGDAARVPSRGDLPPAGKDAETPTVLTKLQKWADYPSVGSPVFPTLFLPMKTPMSLEIINNWTLNHPPKNSLTVPELLQSQELLQRRVGMIIDLANHDCLYADDIPEDVQYAHIQLVAKVLPPKEAIDEVERVAQRYWELHPDRHIAIHCAYGFNRTGFVVCSYLCQACGLTVDEALKSFQMARPPGVKHGKFVDALYDRYGGGDAQPVMPAPTTETHVDDDGRMRVAQIGRERDSYSLSRDEESSPTVDTSHAPEERRGIDALSVYHGFARKFEQESNNARSYKSAGIAINSAREAAPRIDQSFLMTSSPDESIGEGKHHESWKNVGIESDSVSDGRLPKTDQRNDIQTLDAPQSRLRCTVGDGDRPRGRSSDSEPMSPSASSAPIPMNHVSRFRRGSQGSDMLLHSPRHSSDYSRPHRPSFDAWVSCGTGRSGSNSVSLAGASPTQSMQIGGSHASTESEVSLLAERLDAHGVLRRETSLNLARALHEDFSVTGHTPNADEVSPLAKALEAERTCACTGEALVVSQYDRGNSPSVDDLAAERNCFARWNARRESFGTPIEMPAGAVACEERDAIRSGALNSKPRVVSENVSGSADAASPSIDCSRQDATEYDDAVQGHVISSYSLQSTDQASPSDPCNGAVFRVGDANDAGVSRKFVEHTNRTGDQYPVSFTSSEKLMNRSASCVSDNPSLGFDAQEVMGCFNSSYRDGHMQQPMQPCSETSEASKERKGRSVELMMAREAANEGRQATERDRKRNIAKQKLNRLETNCVII